MAARMRAVFLSVSCILSPDEIAAEYHEAVGVLSASASPRPLYGATPEAGSAQRAEQTCSRCPKLERNQRKRACFATSRERVNRTEEWQKPYSRARPQAVRPARCSALVRSDPPKTMLRHTIRLTILKTALEILDALLQEAKSVAAREGTTVKALIEQGMRQVVSQRKQGRPFRLRKATFKGRGLSAEAQALGWERLRQLAYEGRGG